MPPRHHFWRPPPPLPHGPHHGPPPPPPPHPGHWGGATPELQALADRLTRYLGEADAFWAAEVIAYDPGPGRLQSLLSLALLERVEVLLEQLDGSSPAEAEPVT